MRRRFVARLLAALVLVLTLPLCWCGADGPPRPPKPSADQPVDHEGFQENH